MADDFTSTECLNVPDNRTAIFEIMSWDDPVMVGTPRGPDGHFVIDGVVPVEVAVEINALFARRAGVSLDVFGLDAIDLAETGSATDRVLIEALVPFAIAEQAQAICDAHNANLAPIGT